MSAASESVTVGVQPDCRTDISSPPVRLGFLGLGWIGRKRLDAIAQCRDVEVVALADSDQGKLAAAAQAHPDAMALTDLETIFACDVDGVVIATPNCYHAEQAITCLENGIAVFCQKPLATNAADTRRVIDAARSADRLLGIDYCYRHVQGMPELRDRIAAGELGQILAIDLTFHNAYGPDKAWCHDRRSSGGGCLLDLGVHLIDLALWLQDDPSLRLVSSRMFKQGRVVHATDAAVEDLVHAQFVQDNGASVRLACSWNAHAGRDAIIGAEIFGTKAGAAWRNVAGSFYDFEVDLLHGTRRERLGSHPDDWGARALHSWAARLGRDRSFDTEALRIASGAELIEEIYRS